jgi:protein TonB
MEFPRHDTDEEIKRRRAERDARVRRWRETQQISIEQRPVGRPLPHGRLNNQQKPNSIRKVGIGIAAALLIIGAAIAYIEPSTLDVLQRPLGVLQAMNDAVQKRRNEYARLDGEDLPPRATNTVPIPPQVNPTQGDETSGEAVNGGRIEPPISAPNLDLERNVDKIPDLSRVPPQAEIVKDTEKPIARISKPPASTKPAPEKPTPPAPALSADAQVPRGDALAPPSAEPVGPSNRFDELPTAPPPFEATQDGQIAEILESMKRAEVNQPIRLATRGESMPTTSPVAKVVTVPPRLNPRRPMSQPDYPHASMRRGEAGTVLLLLTIDEGGRVRDAEVDKSSGFERLDQAALKEAFRSWTFLPGTRDGTPVPMQRKFAVTFNLDGDTTLKD